MNGRLGTGAEPVTRLPAWAREAIEKETGKARAVLDLPEGTAGRSMRIEMRLEALADVIEIYLLDRCPECSAGGAMGHADGCAAWAKQAKQAAALQALI